MPGESVKDIAAKGLQVKIGISQKDEVVVQWGTQLGAQAMSMDFKQARSLGMAILSAAAHVEENLKKKN